MKVMPPRGRLKLFLASLVLPAAVLATAMPAHAAGLPPVANNDLYNTNEDTTLTVNAPGVLANDTDPENDPLTAAQVSGPSSGNLTLNPDGSFTYTPNPNFNGQDSFTYNANDGTSDSATPATVTIEVAPVNDAPSVTLTGPNAADEGETKTYDFTVSDPDANDTFTVSPGFPDCGANGTLVAGSLNTNASGGSFQCLFPDGPASTDVKIKVQDAAGASDNDNQVVTVAIANVAPTVTLSGDSSADEGQTKTYTYTVTDPGNDPDPQITESCGVNGDYVDTPAPNSFDCFFPDGPATTTVSVEAFDGDDTGSDSIEVAVANVAPTVTLSGDSSAKEGQTKTYTYTVTDPGNDPDPQITESCGANAQRIDTAAVYSFDCFFPDGPATTTVSVEAFDGDDTGSDSIEVAIANVPPVANDDSYSIDGSAALVVPAPGVLANDSDVAAGADPLSASVVSGPRFGKLNLRADGSFTYTPGDFFGQKGDSFTYRVSDGDGGTDTARVTISRECTITGTPGKDVLRGTNGADVICGLGGNDVLIGRGGADVIYGDDGDDVIVGGDQADHLVGGSGKDVLKGRDGDDTLILRDGVRANDVGEGGSGNNSCSSDRGDTESRCS